MKQTSVGLSCCRVVSRVKARSHDAIATAILYSQLMGCMGFNVNVYVTYL